MTLPLVMTPMETAFGVLGLLVTPVPPVPPPQEASSAASAANAAIRSPFMISILWRRSTPNLSVECRFRSRVAGADRTGLGLRGLDLGQVPLYSVVPRKRAIYRGARAAPAPGWCPGGRAVRR